MSPCDVAGTSRRAASARTIRILPDSDALWNFAPAFRLHEMRYASLCCCALAASLLLAIGAANAQLRGHGGAVRALAVSPDGKSLISGSFDTSVIRWSLERNAAEDVLRFHDGAVNAVILLRDGRAATGGEDARIAIWNPSERMPRTVLEGHRAPVAALAASGD